jgi:hypothetical protein
MLLMWVTARVNVEPGWHQWHILVIDARAFRWHAWQQVGWSEDAEVMSFKETCNTPPFVRFLRRKPNHHCISAKVSEHQACACTKRSPYCLEAVNSWSTHTSPRNYAELVGRFSSSIQPSFAIVADLAIVLEVR